MKSSSMLLASLVVVAAACGGGGSKKNPPLVDAGPTPIDTPPTPTCTAPSSATALVNPFMDYTADRDTMTTGNQEYFSFIGDLNEDPKPDWLWIDLYEGAPPGFTTLNFPATPFTIQLTGAELSFATCSTCITFTTDVDVEMSSEMLVYADDYMATGGSITVNTLTATTMSGTLNNVTLAHVDFDMMGVPTANPSGCTTTLAAVPFEGMVMAARDGGTRKGVRSRFKQ